MEVWGHSCSDSLPNVIFERPVRAHHQHLYVRLGVGTLVVAEHGISAEAHAMSFVFGVVENQHLVTVHKRLQAVQLQATLQKHVYGNRSVIAIEKAN